MRALVDWLLNLSGVNLSGSHLRLELAEAPAAWLAAFLAVGLVVYTAWVYRQEGSTLRRRILLAGLRAGVLLLVLGLIFRPVLVVERTESYPSLVIVLADESGSMKEVKDRYADKTEAAQAALAAGLVPADSFDPQKAPDLPPAATAKLQALTRHDILTRLLAHPEWANMLVGNRLELVRFADGSDEAGIAATPAEWSKLVQSLPPIGGLAGGTRLYDAVRSALVQARGQRIAGVVLLSDGRNTSDDKPEDAIREARRGNVPVFPILLGSSTAPQDLWLGPLEAESAVYVRDRLAVRTTVGQRGLKDPVSITVQLKNADTGAKLASQTVTLGGEVREMPVELRFKPNQAGQLRLMVNVEPQPGEVESANNSAAATVRVVEDKLRVLYVENLPRWEYRYLKTMMVREPTIASSLWLDSAIGSGFAQEGTNPIRALPSTQQEINEYDVILLGDVDPAITLALPGMMELLSKFVSERGGGLAFIAGAGFNPTKFLGTPLERVLPIRPDPVTSGDKRDYSVAYEPQLTPEGKVSSLLRLEDDPAKSLQRFERLPPWYWHARVLGARPGAEVLLQHPSASSDDGPIPLLVTSRFGAGKTLYLGSDETWRWRKGVGEEYHETFWLQVMRFLSRDKLRGAIKDAVVSFDVRRGELGVPRRVSLNVLNPELLAGLRQNATVQILDESKTVVGSVELIRTGEKTKEFVGGWVAPAPGRYVARWQLPGQSETTAPVSDPVEITRPDAENRDLSSDHAALQQLADQTGGKALTPDQMAKLPLLIGDRSQQVSSDLVRDLWDTRLSMILIVVLLTTEWIVRKASGLV